MIWLTGCKGMLGSDFERLLSDERMPFVSTDSEVDITEKDAISSFLRSYGDISHIVNCAAFTDVDAAEKEPHKALRINGAGPGNLAELSRQKDICLYHISTDYIFPGDGKEPWETDSTPDPVNAYGQSKLLGERNIMNSGCRYAIFRTQWLYGRGGNNFVHTVARKLMENALLRVVDDQVGAVTNTADVAGVVIACIRTDVTGIRHVVNSGYASWFETALEMQKLLGTSARISPCTSEEYALPAKRPKNSRLSLRSLAETGMNMRHWRAALAAYLQKGAIV